MGPFSMRRGGIGEDDDDDNDNDDVFWFSTSAQRQLIFHSSETCREQLEQTRALFFLRLLHTV